jgi:aerotaxis receptor
MSKRNQSVVDEEVTFNEGEELVSTTDLRGVITYANTIFCRIAGYELDELVGNNHNMVRHPDMPKAAFKDMWAKLQNGENWRGAVKNRCKDGRYYWVDAYVCPIFENGQLIGYQSVRAKLSEKDKQSAIKAYKALNQGKNIEGWYSHLNSRHTLFALFSAATLAGTIAISNLFAFVLPILPFIFYADELIKTPAYFKRLKSEYDSASRWVFSGTKSYSVADYHIKVQQGKVRTILGRVVDIANVMEDGVAELNNASSHAKVGVEKQTHELHQVSTAVEEMVATISSTAVETW